MFRFFLLATFFSLSTACIFGSPVKAERDYVSPSTVSRDFPCRDSFSLNQEQNPRDSLDGNSLDNDVLPRENRSEIQIMTPENIPEASCFIEPMTCSWEIAPLQIPKSTLEDLNYDELLQYYDELLESDFHLPE